MEGYTLLFCSNGQLFISAGDAGESGQWVKRSSLVDSRTSVTDVKFAPKHLGLQLVSVNTGQHLLL